MSSLSKTLQKLLESLKNRGSLQTCPRGVPVPDDEDEEEVRPLHDRELGSCWGEGHLAQGGFDDGVDVGFDVDADVGVYSTILFTNMLILKTQGEVAFVKKTLLKVAFGVLVVLTLSMLHTPCTHFVSIASTSSQI